MHKPHAISDQNGPNLYPTSDQKGSKTIPFGAAHTYIDYIREYPPLVPYKFLVWNKTAEFCVLSHGPRTQLIRSIKATHWTFAGLSELAPQLPPTISEYPHKAIVAYEVLTDWWRSKQFNPRARFVSGFFDTRHVCDCIAITYPKMFDGCHQLSWAASRNLVISSQKMAIKVRFAT